MKRLSLEPVQIIGLICSVCLLIYVMIGLTGCTVDEDTVVQKRCNLQATNAAERCIPGYQCVIKTGGSFCVPDETEESEDSTSSTLTQQESVPAIQNSLHKSNVEFLKQHGFHMDTP